MATNIPDWLVPLIPAEGVKLSAPCGLIVEQVKQSGDPEKAKSPYATQIIVIGAAALIAAAVFIFKKR